MKSSSLNVSKFLVIPGIVYTFIFYPLTNDSNIPDNLNMNGKYDFNFQYPLGSPIVLFLF